MNAKEYLGQAYWLDKRINSKLNMVMSLRETATKTTSVMHDDVVSHTRNVHSMQDVIVKIIEIERELDADIDRLVDLKAEVRRAISQVEEPEQQLVLELRYLCYKKWSEIMIELNYSEPTVYRLHDEALKKIAVPDQ